VSKLAIAHEWLAVRAGSEKTFEAMAQAYPDADLYALTWDRDAQFDFSGRPVTTTLLDRWPALRDRRELALPLMSLAWKGIDVRDTYDTVLTSSHAFVRSFPPAKSATHFCYCHTPLRYAWVPDVDARTQRRIPGKSVAFAGLREWDRRTAGNVDFFAANSTAVRDRIHECYGRDSVVIHPPVDTVYYDLPEAPVSRARALAVSRFVPYKSVALAIEACAAAEMPITVAGKGPQEQELRALATRLGADVEFEISPPDERLRELYRSCAALVFPANEDFGIIPVEAQACGAPVVALDVGGARDTVVQGETGIRVARQEVGLFAEAIRELAASPPDPSVCRRNAEGFSVERFIRELRDWIARSS
jgi:glycosyltransferase involved in cell wall biosynthesis